MRISSTKELVDMGLLEAGLYLYLLKVENQVVATGKLAMN